MRPGDGRLALLFAGFVALLIVLIVKLADIQIIQHDHFRDLALRQHRCVRPIVAKRGAILDRNLKPLAMTLPAYRVFADPKVIDDPAGVAAQLAKVLSTPYRAILSKLSDRQSRYKLLERALDVDKALMLKRLGIVGLYVEPSGKRVRPMDDIGLNVIGLLSTDGYPLAGVELMLDSHLKGQEGLQTYLRDALGTARPCLHAVFKQPKGGHSVKLTIDADLQADAQRALNIAVTENHAKGGCVVVLDPWTGDILALASDPLRRNFPVRAVFEPGSALKIVTYSAALEMGVVDRSSSFDTQGGKLRVAGGWIRDDHPRDHGMDITEAFQISSNVAAAMIARLVGTDGLYRYLRAFGFGAKTGIDLGGEPKGILREPDDWSKRSLETLAIGQEIGVTPIQLAMAYAAVANGGILLRPRLVQAIMDDGGNVTQQFPVKAVRRVIRRETAEELTRLMEAVVEGGTGVLAGIEGIDVAGKTGTGQKAESGSYIPGKFYSAFGGFLPAHDPRYVCLVVIDEPHGRSHYGGVVCGPVFRAVMESLLRRERQHIPETCLRLSVPCGEGVPASDAMAASVEFRAAAPMAAPGSDTYPSVVGLALREATSRLVEAGLEWKAYGSGVVVKQDPPPLTRRAGEGLCTIWLD